MRTAMVLVLSGFLALACTPPQAAAQLKSAPNPARLSLLPSLPGPAQSPEASTAPPTPSTLGRGLPANQASVLRSLADRADQLNPFSNRTWKSPKPTGNLEASAIPPAGTATCAHILIVPRSSADSKMVIRVPNANTVKSGMPGTGGLPPCREDYR